MSRETDALDRIVGASVRLYRVKRGMSQASLGTAVGVAGQQVQKYERAVDRVPASRLYRIALALSVPLDAFFVLVRVAHPTQRLRDRELVSARMIGFWKRRRERVALVKADAAALIEQFGDRAYGQARLRTHEPFDGTVIDGNRPAGHWDRVQAEIARVTGRRDRVDTATRYLQD